MREVTLDACIWGGQKKRLRDMIQQELKCVRLKKEDIDDRSKWGRRARGADPSPGMNSFKPEEDIHYNMTCSLYLKH